MNSRERFVGALTGAPVDRVPFMPIFGSGDSVVPAWEIEEPGLSGRIYAMLKFEGVYRGWQDAWVNMFLCGEPEPVVLEDNDQRTIVKTGCGSVVLRRKTGDFHSATLEFAVKNRKDWENIRDRFLDPNDERRFPKNWDERCKGYNERDYALQLSIPGVYNTARILMGDEALSYAFYDDPDFVQSMMGHVSDMAITIWGKMCKGVEQFDLIESWEAMAYKCGCLISPATFRQFIKPQYQKFAAFAEDHNIKILLGDTHGFIEDLADLMLESGFTAMYPFEIQAGNDIARVMDRYPTLGIIGGLDKNCMAKGKKEIDAEITKARKLLARRGRYIPGQDYFPLSDVPFENYRYFMEQLRQAILETERKA